MNYAIFTIIAGAGAAVAVLCALIGIPGRRLLPAAISSYIGLVWGACAGLLTRSGRFSSVRSQQEMGESAWSLTFYDGGDVAEQVLFGLCAAAVITLVLVLAGTFVMWLRGWDDQDDDGDDEDDTADEDADSAGLDADGNDPDDGSHDEYDAKGRWGEAYAPIVAPSARGPRRRSRVSGGGR